MASESSINDQIVDAVSLLARASSSAAEMQTAGAGKAYQLVAQSAAMAFQDATDVLRNVTTISMTTMGTAMAQWLATGDQKYADVIDRANAMMTNAAEYFRTVGQNAAVVLNGFPAGEQQ